MPQPTSKRPGILAWIGLGLVVLIAVAIVKVLFFAAIPQTYTTQPSSGGVAFGNDASYDKSAMQRSAAPPMAPMPTEMGEAAGSAAGMPATTPSDGQDMQRVIKTGELMLRVQDAPQTVGNIQAMVTAKHGYVESSSVSDSGTGPRTAWLTIRVPADAFESTIQELKASATLVLNESVHGQDVTAEFVDLEADLRNAKAEEASYLEIMKRAGKIEEVLDVARSLAEVRGRIERLEGRKRYLSNQTDLATITVTLTEDTRIEAPGRTWKPIEVFRQAIQQLVESLQNLVDFLIQAVIAIIGLLLPILLIAAFVSWLGWKIVKAIMRRMNK